MLLLRSGRKPFSVSYSYSVGTTASYGSKLVNRYYDICHSTNPEYLPAVIKLPWGYYAQCESTLAGANCTSLGFGLAAVNASLLYSTLQPNGTETLSNQGGTLTSPPYGSTTAWYFFGSTGPATTATAAAYTTGKQGAQPTQGSTVSGFEKGSPSPSPTKSGAASEVGKVKGAVNLILVTLGLCLAWV